MTALTFGRRIVFVIALLWVSACSAPAAEPAATPTLTATATVVAPDSSTPTPPIATTPAVLPFSLALPTGWLSNTTDARGGNLPDLIPPDAPPMLTARLDDLLAGGAVASILLAWPGDATPLAASELGLMAVTVPAEDLRLPTAVSATVASLVRSGEVTVTHAALTPALRRGGEPVGQIDYQLGQAFGQISGRQFIIHDIDARQLAILTFSGSTEKMEQFAPQIAEAITEIVRSVVIVSAP